MWKQVPSLNGNKFDDATFNTRTCIIVVEDNMVLFVRSFCLDCSVKAVKLCQVDVAVDVELPLAIFVRDSPLLPFIRVVKPITNAI